MRLIYGDVLMDLYANRLELLCERYGPDSSECGVLAGAMKLLEAQPTIEERKTGEWIKCPNRGWGEIWECNHCGETTVSSIMGEPRYRFCPMCGYEMLNGGEPDESD